MSHKITKRDVELISTSDLTPYARNSRTHSPQQIKQIAASIREFGFTVPILIDENRTIIAGHGRVLAAEHLGISEVPAIRLDHLTDAQKKAYVIADNKLALNAGWDEEMLRVELEDLHSIGYDISGIGFDADELNVIMGYDQITGVDEQSPETRTKTLAERFGIPPFSVLNARDGWWRKRKQAWIETGIKSELGRGGKLTYQYEGVTSQNLNYYREQNKKAKQHVSGVLMQSDSGNDPQYYFKKQEVEKRLGRSISTEEFQRDHYEGPKSYESGTSVFDPVLCELLYRWFTPVGGHVLDPFAGGSVRGIVAAKLGREYTGIELREEQVAANRIQWQTISPYAAPDADAPTDGIVPQWIVGDSLQIDDLLPDQRTDFVFSCPPYADLEVYSDDPRDLSTMPYDQFRDIYTEIIRKACDRLRPDRFACFVVGEVRDRSGNYYDFVGDTIKAFRAAGLRYYNEAILVTAVGSLPVRTARQFIAGRKLGKTHQNVLVFVKGDGKKAAAACGDCEVATDLEIDDEI